MEQAGQHGGNGEPNLSRSTVSAAAATMPVKEGMGTGYGQRYFTAMGLTGEPTALVTGSGAAVSQNSYTPSAA